MLINVFAWTITRVGIGFVQTCQVFDPEGKWSAVLAGGRQSRTSAWPEYLKKKMERSEVAREEEEMDV